MLFVSLNLSATKKVLTLETIQSSHNLPTLPYWSTQYASTPPLPILWGAPHSKVTVEVVMLLLLPGCSILTIRVTCANGKNILTQVLCHG